MLTKKPSITKKARGSHLRRSRDLHSVLQDTKVKPNYFPLKPTGQAIFANELIKKSEKAELLEDIQSFVNKYSEELNSGIELNKIGANTELIAQLEIFFDSPLEGFLELHSTFENAIKAIIDIHVQQYFKTKLKLIHSAFRTKTEFDDLHYCIVLKKDTSSNRLKVFDFFNQYDLLSLSEKFPVYFQYVPIELIDKINVVSELELA